MRHRQDIDEETDGPDTDEPDAPRRSHRSKAEQAEIDGEDTDPELIDYGGDPDEDGDEMDGYQIEE